jgi:hypothetical protein
MTLLPNLADDENNTMAENQVDDDAMLENRVDDDIDRTRVTK